MKRNNKTLKKETIIAEPRTEPQEINPRTGKPKGKTPEIIYTTDDIYTFTTAKTKPQRYIPYTQQEKDEITNKILSLISEGNSTSKATALTGINIRTFYDWCDKDSFLYAAYVRACERLGIALFDRILDEVESMTSVESSIIASKKIDALKWLSGKLNNRFSDRSDVYIQNVNNTLNTNTSELSQADREKLMKSILSKLNNKIEGIEEAKKLLNG